MRWCPQEVPGTVPDVRGHEGGICAQPGRLLGTDGWGEALRTATPEAGLAGRRGMQDLREEPCFRLEYGEGGKPWGCGWGAKDSGRGPVETNSGKEGRGLMGESEKTGL